MKVRQKGKYTIFDNLWIDNTKLRVHIISLKLTQTSWIFFPLKKLGSILEGMTPLFVVLSNPMTNLLLFVQKYSIVIGRRSRG